MEERKKKRIAADGRIKRGKRSGMAKSGKSKAKKLQGTRHVKDRRFYSQWKVDPALNSIKIFSAMNSRFLFFETCKDFFAKLFY